MKTILRRGLSPSVKQSELRQLFEEHGTVMGVDLAEGQDFGFVRMVDAVQGRKAIDALDGTLCAGITLSVGVAHTRQQQKAEINKAASATEVTNG